MAGGMGKKDGAVPSETLADRVANTRARQAGHVAAGHGTADLHGKRPNAPAAWTASTPAPSLPSTPPRLRHCWYDGPYGRQPALHLKWRNVSGHYEGLVILAVPDEEGAGWAVVEMYVDAAMLRPA